jgi:hypothetical protein
MTVETHPGEGAHKTTVPLPMERAWRALRAAFDSVAVPVSIFDAATHTLGNGQFRVVRRLGNTPLSKLVNCGNTQGGPSADTYELQLSVVSTATAVDAAVTSIATTVQAQGRPITLSAEYVRCTTTGALEKRISNVVSSQVLNR